VLPSRGERKPPLEWNAPVRFRLLGGAIVLAALIAVPSFAGSKLEYWTAGIAAGIALLSLGLLVRTSGQVSLCQAAFAGIGAAAFSHFSVDFGVPWLLALLLGALVVVPVAALVALPAIRLSGLYLALATFAFGVMIEQLFYGLDFLFSTSTLGRSMPRPSLGASDKGFYYVCLAIGVVVTFLILAINRSRLGRLLRGLSDSPMAVATSGLTTQVTLVIVFCISGFIAAISGILYGVSIHTANASDSHFLSFASLVLLCELAIAPGGAPWYALIAVIGTVIPGYLTGDNTTYWLNAIFGLFAIMVALQGGTPTVPPRVKEVLERFGRKRMVDDTHALGATTEIEPVVAPATASAGLEVIDLSIRFGGVQAINRVNLKAATGRITGLIGPNGAGKTTTFNACSGLNKPSSGRVLLDGADISRRGPAARSRHGLGRTFQLMQLCDTLSVADNVALGREASIAGAHVITQMVARPGERRQVERSARAAMELCGINDLADLQAGQLSTGQRRLVELARCLSGDFDVLLLDEPSSGLDRDETQHFGAVLTRVVEERGCGILLVEHDMSLVMGICTYIYVLDFGEMIFEGTPAEVSASPTVRSAYLGYEAAEAPAATAPSGAVLDPQ
jgi:ABC-type branched-subunit amino acid transport system ATPase component/ABC-type branched-subunit amino acid transport system permease subunit